MYDMARAECGDAICREFSTLQYPVSLLDDSLYLRIITQFISSTPDLLCVLRILLGI